jgi:heat shock protein HtpX
VSGEAAAEDTSDAEYQGGYAMSSVLRTTVLLAALTALFLVIGGALGGNQGLVIAFVFALLMNFASYWFSDKIVLSMYGAQEVSPHEAPDLHRLVQRLAQRAGIPMPRVYIIPSDAPNAFATGRNPQHGVVAVTEGIMRLLDEDELAGVLAHELGHVRNRDTLIMTVAATLAGAITMLAHMAQWGVIFGFGRRDDEDSGSGGVLGLLFMAILAPIAATLIQLAISRSREYFADSTGAGIAGSPSGLARALEKLHYASQRLPMAANPATAHLFIVNPLSGESLLALFSTHPPIEERIRRLRSLSPVRG